jgi:hypothetical protein
MTCIVLKFHSAIGTVSKQCVSGIGNISMGLKIGRNQGCVQLLEIGLSYPKSCIRWRQHLKGLLHERGGAKSSENLGTSPFKRDLSIDTTFSQIILAGQSL